MLAQKTPVTALTMHLNDSWNSFYFQDLTNFKNQLLEDYQLRFLILNYLNQKRYWLRRFSIKKNNGFYFINVDTVSAQPLVFFQPLLLAKPIILNNKLTKSIQLKIFQLQKKLTPPLLLKNKFKQTNKSLVYNNVQIRTKKNYDLDFLTKIYKYLNRTQKQLINKFKFLNKQSNFKKFNTNNRFFSTNNNIKMQTFNFKKQNIIFNQKLPVVIKYLPKNFLFKKSSYNNNVLAQKPRKWLLFMRYIVKKFFLKKKKNWKMAITAWLIKWGHKKRFKRNILRRLNTFAYNKLAIERLTGALCFFSFTVAYWHVFDYKALRGFVAFERHHSKRFFNQLMAATHYTLSQGVPSVLTDYLRSVLQYESKHMPVLNALQSAAHYWLCYRGSTRILNSVLCQGVKFEVIGKLDGSERTRTWRTYIGSIPTSTFNSNIRYEQTIVATRYGILHVHVWLYYENNLSALSM